MSKKRLSEKIAAFCSDLGASAKGLVKIAAQSRRCTVKAVAQPGERLVIMGNGPSLADNISSDLDKLTQAKTLAVNFAANTEVFCRLRPDFYLLADPHFYPAGNSDPNVIRLYQRFNTVVDWPMTLFVPAACPMASLGITNPLVRVERFNPVGVEGFGWLTRLAYSSGRAMPRPRNVLIPAIMVGMLMGFKEICLIGADHSGIAALGVNENNEVVSGQTHYYKDNREENRRAESVYKGVHLHDILQSFHVAFKAYHQIADYAAARGVEIYNCTPGSFIDAFPRRRLS